MNSPGEQYEYRVMFGKSFDGRSSWPMYSADDYDAVKRWVDTQREQYPEVGRGLGS